MYIFLEGIFSLLDFIYLHIYLKIFLHRKQSNKIYAGVSISIFSILLYYFTHDCLYRKLSNMICIILMIIYTFICFKGDIKTKVLISILFSVIEASISALVVNLIAGTLMKSIGEIMNFNTLQRVLIVILVKIIILAMIRILRDYNLYLKLDIAYKYKYMLMGVSIFSLLCIAAITEVSLNTGEAEICRLAVIVIVNMIMFNMAILILINKISNYLQEENTLKIIINSQEILNRSIREVDNKEKAIRKIKHDMLNHFSVVGYLINSGNLSKAMEYVNELQKEVEQTSVYFKTGNIIADAVINQKIELGKADGIKFNIKVAVPQDIKITETDLGALLSNLLDNAIEAVREVEEDKRIIDINIHPHNTRLLIDVTNTVAYNPINQGKLSRRKKENYKEHGYGMKSIQYVVNKYDGYLEYTCKEDEFNVSILVDIL